MIFHKDNRDWRKTFQHAVDGCLWAFRTQKNFKVHFAVAFVVLIWAWWLKIEPVRFLILILAIIFGLVVEMANTAFEKTIDLITEEYHLDAKIAKDVAAGMMLITAIGLTVIGILVLVPALLEKLFVG